MGAGMKPSERVIARVYDDEYGYFDGSRHQHKSALLATAYRCGVSVKRATFVVDSLARVWL